MFLCALSRFSNWNIWKTIIPYSVFKHTVGKIWKLYLAWNMKMFLFSVSSSYWKWNRKMSYHLLRHLYVDWQHFIMRMSLAQPLQNVVKFPLWSFHKKLLNLLRHLNISLSTVRLFVYLLELRFLHFLLGFCS